jgi:hypothetical protein
MDLYKWAYKFYPWISSDLIGQAFELAIFAREIDMRASPYDLAEHGYPPILIETDWGKRQYQQLQREVARRARPVRAKLVMAYEELLRALRPEAVRRVELTVQLDAVIPVESG